MSPPSCSGSVKIRNVDEYFEILKDRFVILDPLIRKNIILNQIKERIKQKRNRMYRIILLDEVTNLVEYPKVLQGEFDKNTLIYLQKYYYSYGKTPEVFSRLW